MLRTHELCLPHRSQCLCPCHFPTKDFFAMHFAPCCRDRWTEAELAGSPAFTVCGTSAFACMVLRSDDFGSPAFVLPFAVTDEQAMAMGRLP